MADDKMNDAKIEGKWLVSASVMFNRWVAREIVGETDKFFITQAYRPDGTCDEIAPRRKKKASLGRHLILDDRAAAERIAGDMTADLLAEAERHAKHKKAILDSYLSHEDT